MLVFFYVNYFLLIPRIYFNKKYIGYWCCDYLQILIKLGCYA